MVIEAPQQNRVRGVVVIGVATAVASYGFLYPNAPRYTIGSLGSILSTQVLYPYLVYRIVMGAKYFATFR
jgi:hypothetical protein